LSLIDSLKTRGPAVAEVDQVRGQMARAHALNLQNNTFWLHNLAARDQSGEDPVGLLAPYEELIRKLAAPTIKQAAQRYFDTTNFAKFVLLPQTQ
jgi:zinc protease